jgi:hypothetical protein
MASRNKPSKVIRLSNDVDDDNEGWEDWDDGDTANSRLNELMGAAEGVPTNTQLHIKHSIQLPTEAHSHGNSSNDDNEDDDDGVVNVEKGEVENEERIEEILLSLKEFQRDLADISVLDKINRRLSSISFDQFCAYYDDANNSNSGHSNKLAQYTIETELKRMKFSVLFDGIVYNTEDSIINVFERTYSHDLWKMANQSIYAELLLSLQKQFFRQDLCISFVSTESVFAIDLDMGTLHTQSSFRIMTMSEDAATKKDRSRSTSNSNSRSGSVTPTTPVLASTPRTPRNTLELASISGEIRVDVQRQTLLQRVYNSALQMVFEADLRFDYLLHNSIVSAHFVDRFFVSDLQRRLFIDNVWMRTPQATVLPAAVGITANFDW